MISPSLIRKEWEQLPAFIEKRFLPKARRFALSLPSWRTRTLVPAQKASLPADLSEDRPPSQEGKGWLLSFLGLVILPTLVFFLYSMLWKSSGYVAESRVSVRGAQELKGPALDSANFLGRLASAGGPKVTMQDAYMVLNYIKSAAIISELGRNQYLEKYFSSSDIDYFSRLQPNQTIEELQKYWLRHIMASVDTASGVLTLKVEAFSPEDALAISQDIVSKSESFINHASDRSRKDALQRALGEISLASEKLAQTRDRLTNFRNQNALIDPALRATNISNLIAQLTLAKIDLENSLDASKSSLDADSPTRRIQRSKLAAIDQQIADLNRSLTSPNNDKALSSQLSGYEHLKLEEQFNEFMYTIAQSSYQRARQDLERQAIYLVLVVPPQKPQEAIYPRTFIDTFILFVSLGILWAIGALIVASIRDQLL